MTWTAPFQFVKISKHFCRGLDFWRFSSFFSWQYLSIFGNLSILIKRERKQLGGDTKDKLPWNFFHVEPFQSNLEVHQGGLPPQEKTGFSRAQTTVIFWWLLWLCLKFFWVAVSRGFCQRFLEVFLRFCRGSARVLPRFSWYTNILPPKESN